jgi:hypothetical protein
MKTELDKQQLAQLALRLAEATAAKRIEWRSPEADVFEWAAAGGIVTVASRDRDSQPPFELAVFNGNRQKLDDLESDLIDDQPAPWNGALADLYSVARRSALRADDVIEALLSTLRGLDGDDRPREEMSREQAPHERSLLGRALRSD